MISYFKTYDIGEAPSGTNRINSYRLVKPLPRPTWQEELIEQPWFQPSVTRAQAEYLLAGVTYLSMNCSMILFSFAKVR